MRRVWPRASIHENEAIDTSRVAGLIICYFPCTKLHLPLRFHTVSRFQLVLNIHVSRTHRAIVCLSPPRKLSALTRSSPFLAFVSNTQQFDDRLKVYTTSNYVQLKYVELLSLSRPSTYLNFRYQQLLGCNNINLKNTTNLYARYTTSVICNSIVQNSISLCSLSGAKARPLCAETCVSGLGCHFSSILRHFSRLSKPPARSK